jgi:hypothetical protein
LAGKGSVRLKGTNPALSVDIENRNPSRRDLLFLKLLNKRAENMIWWQYSLYWVPTLGFMDWVEVLGTVTTFIIAVLVFTAQLQRDRNDKRLQKPYLNIINIQGYGWVLMNIGQGPALNVRFSDKDVDWFRPVIGYAIPPNTALLIKPEIQVGYAIAATYNDVLQNIYVAHCAGDTTTVKERGKKDWDKESEELYNLLHKDVRRSDKLVLKTF